MMAKKVAAEGEKEEEMFEKFMCYCETAGDTLKKSIEEAEAKVPELMSAIEEAEAQKKQLEEDVEKHRKDRADAKDAIEQATAIREKEAAEFAKENAEANANIDALDRAIPAIEKGMGQVGGMRGAPLTAEQATLQAGRDANALLQTAVGKADRAQLRSLVTNGEFKSVDESDRATLLAFLSENAPISVDAYAPQSGEILGILKQLRDEMQADRQEAIDAEEKAKKEFEELVTAKEKEIEAATKAIEEKLQRIGDLGVEIVNLKNDLEETAGSLLEDKKFLADLEKNCATKKKEWAIRSKTRAEEILAIQETIKILNDDDALELFKKTLPGPKNSLLQVDASAKDLKRRALDLIRNARKGKGGHQALDLIAMALSGKKIGFEKVIKMIDEMTATLKQEQKDDDDKKEYCEVTIDKYEDDIKELKHTVEDLESKIADTEESIATLADEIKALEDGIAALDKAVASATETRKEENAEFTDLMASDSAAKELIAFAKNRLMKFYNPKLYKPPPKRELTEEERITLNMGGTLAPTNPPAGIAGTGITVLQQKEAPPPPPEMYGEYQKKGEESNGVVAMMDALIGDLDKEMQEAEMEEKLAQEDYEQYMKDSAEKRANDSKAITEKEVQKAGLQAELQDAKDSKKAQEKELLATQQFLADTHADCDWLLENFDLRKQARADELDALGRAKAVLSGADFSEFVQLASVSRHLRH